MAIGDDYIHALNKTPIQPQVKAPSMLERIGFHIANSPMLAVEGMQNAVKTLSGETERPPSDLLDIAPGTSTSEKVVDFLGGGLLPIAEEIAMTGGLARVLGTGALAARSPLAARIVNDAAAFGVIGAQEDKITALEQTAEGAGYGALTALSRGRRVLPAAALALGSKMFFDRNGEQEIGYGFGRGDVSGAAGFLTSFLPGKVPLRPLTDHFAPVASAVDNSKALAVLPEQPRVFQGQVVEPTGPTVYGQPPSRIPLMEGDTAFNTVNRSTDVIPMPPPQRLALPAPRVEPTMPASIPGAESIPQATKGKMRPLPEFKTSQGGFTTPELNSAIARAGVGGLLGGTIGTSLDPEGRDGMALGIALGAGAFVAAPTLLRYIKEFKNRTIIPPTGAAGGVSVSRTWDYNEAVAKANFAKSRGVDTILDRSISRFDKWFSTSRSPEFNRVLQRSQGLANYQLANMDEALRKASVGFKPPQTLVDDTTKFMTGKIDEATYLQPLQNADEASIAYANLMVEARNSMRGLMEQGAQAQASPARAKMMIDTGDEYLRNSYQLFTKGKLPSEQAVNELADHLTKTNQWTNLSLDGKREALWQYAKEINQSKGLFKASTGNGPVASTVDQSVFKHRKALDQEWKNYLGEITDPAERVRLTLLKIKPMAEAGNFMSQVTAGLKDSKGNPMVFQDRTALEAFRKANPQGGAELANYRYQPTDYRYGQLGGKMVHRQIAEVLDDWESATKVDSAAGRFMLGVNRFMKSNVTYRNPAAIVRQFLGMPLFATIAKANPEHFGESVKAMRDSKSALGREMIENGIINADAVTRDVMSEVDSITSGLASLGGNASQPGILGKMDEGILKATGKVRSLDRKMADLFRAPDNMVRANTYVSAKYRFAKELNKAVNDSEVIAKATDFTNRYTMNYDLVGPIIKSGRNIPGVSLFLTYTAEITRLMKNLGQDIYSGSPSQKAHALMALGVVAALPQVMQSNSESNLSDKDRKDWEKVKAGLPVYSKHRFKVVTGREKNGSFNYVDFSSIVPIDNYVQMVKALSEGNIKEAAQLNPVFGWDNAPLFNVVAQNITGEDRYTKRELKGAGDRFATVARELGGPLTPSSGSIWRAGEQAFSYNADGTQGITDKGGRRLTPSDFFRRLGGVGSGQYNLGQIQRGQIAEAKADIANEMAYLNDIIKSDVAKEKKQAAAERAKLAIDQINKRLQIELNPEAVSSLSTAP